MPSVVDLCNRALSRLGAGRITALTDDTKAARACNSAWPIVRDEVLRSAPWKCLSKRASLAADSTDPEWGYDYSYTLPSDFVRMLEVDTDYDWQIEGGAVVTDEGAPLYIRYVRSSNDPNEYDDLLASVVSSRLEAEIAQEITQNNTRHETAWTTYRSLLLEARRINAQERSPSEFEEDDWVTARYR